MKPNEFRLFVATFKGTFKKASLEPFDKTPSRYPRIENRGMGGIYDSRTFYPGGFTGYERNYRCQIIYPPS